MPQITNPTLGYDDVTIKNSGGVLYANQTRESSFIHAGEFVANIGSPSFSAGAAVFGYHDVVELDLNDETVAYKNLLAGTYEVRLLYCLTDNVGTIQLYANSATQITASTFTEDGPSLGASSVNITFSTSGTKSFAVKCSAGSVTYLRGMTIRRTT